MAKGVRASSPRGRVALSLFLALLTTTATAGALASDWPDTVRQVSGLLNDGAEAYEARNVERAKELVSEAYFGAFEERGMEIAIRQQISARRAGELERMFSEIRQAMGRGERIDRVRERIAALRRALDRDAQELLRLGVTEARLAEEEDHPTARAEATPPGSPLGPRLRDLFPRLDEALARYRAGDRDQATALLGSAYFDVFEGQGLEASIGATFPRRKTEIEARFARIRSLMVARAPSDTVGHELAALRATIQDAVALLDQRQGHVAAFLNGLIIIVREGFEAILIITALVAYLVRLGHAEKVRVVYQASGLALLASLLTAVLIRTLVRVNPRHQETLEGLTMLLATAVLFYVSYWLTSKAETERWQQYIRKKVQASLGTGSLLALGSAAFLAVYREGAETILFYQALLAGANPGEAGAIFGGLGAGVLALALIFLLLRSSAIRIPVGAFFAVTSALLYYLALVFAGTGIRELQASGLIGITPARWIPAWEPLGLYPTWESVGLQMLLVGAAAFALGYLFLIRGNQARAAAAQR